MSLKCANCRDTDLVQVMTKNGVLVDYCPRCNGIWLDKSEIYYFTNTPTYLRMCIEEALKNHKPSQRLNPRTQKPLVELNLSKGDLIIDYCPETQGIWLDKGEIDKLPASKGIKMQIDLDRGSSEEIKQSVPMALPNLGLVSGVTLFLLYSFITLILIICVNFGLFDAGFALLIGIIIAFLQFIFSPFLMDLSLRFFYKIEWATPQDLPQHLREFVSKVTTQRNIKFPRMGIIQDGSPNAFTYGHTPNNARIVITRGLMDLLEPEELESVVAHEIGHAVHWDMLVMTIAYLVPLILYYIYRTLIRIKSRGKEDKSAPLRLAIAMGSYILYIISEYIVLWFSRIREYFADRFSGEITNPAILASALVKIGYGLAGREKKKEERQPQLEAVKALGIFDANAARALAISSYRHTASSMGGEVDKENLKGAMRWDLWNPWAVYYELHSTHPLIAKRLLALSLQSESQGKQAYIRFDEKRPESYWDEFLTDVFISWLPLFVVIFSLILFFTNRNNVFYLKAGLALFGLSYLFVVNFSYDFKDFPEFNISSLLKKVKVSAIRPVPCILKGKIIGRGVPGLIWSEDFVLQDSSGIMFLDYRQPLGIWSFLFGLLRAGKFIGEDVKITGWYRRSPVPYVEIKTLETATDKSTCFVFNLKRIFAIILIVSGVLSFLKF